MANDNARPGPSAGPRPAAIPAPIATPGPGPADARPGWDLPHFPVRVAAPDLTPWIAGNTGVAGFTLRDSGIPGPHVMLVSLIHGNEIAGAIALDRMLRADFRPARGKLTFGFANLEAFARFDPENPIASRFIDEDMNRVWDDAQLFGVRRSLELDRARAIQPLIETADIVLDLHSMLWPSDALLLSGSKRPGRDVALAIATPPLVVADQGHAGGKRLIDYGRFTQAGSAAAGILVEAGQHWQTDTVRQTTATITALLDHVGQRREAPREDFSPPPCTRARFATVTRTVTANTARFTFLREFRGGEIIAKAGTVIALDGSTEIRTPHPQCLLVMPSLRPSRGHTAVRLAQFEAVETGAGEG
jgi:succinylglutamate desuccinylase